MYLWLHSTQFNNLPWQPMVLAGYLTLHRTNKSKCLHSVWTECQDVFSKGWAAYPRSHGVLWGFCSNNRGSEECDGAEAQSDLCYVTWWPGNICSPSSLDMCGMNRSFPGESKLFVRFSSLHLFASTLLPFFFSLLSVYFLYPINLVRVIMVYFYFSWFYF